MPIGAAAIIGGGSIVGSLIGGNAASGAAKQSAEASKYAALLQKYMFDQTSGNLSPFIGAGQNALGQLQGLMNDQPGGVLRNPLSDLGPVPQYNMPEFTSEMFHHSSGYNAALQGQTEALQNAGAGRTGALSGNVLRALSGAGTQLANQDFQQGYSNYATNYQNQFGANNQNFWNQLNQGNQQNQNIFSRLFSLGQTGQNAAAGLGGIGQTAATNAGSALIGAGNAGAAGTLGVANSQIGGINSLSTLLNGPSNQNSIISQILASLSGGGGGNQGYTPGADYGGGGDRNY